MTTILQRSLVGIQDLSTRFMFGKALKSNADAFYDLADQKMSGERVTSMSTYEGSVLLIVNVASNWGMTDANYSQLVRLYDKYHTQGLEILAFPCNQFMGQEPVSEKQYILFETLAGRLMFVLRN